MELVRLIFFSKSKVITKSNQSTDQATECLFLEIIARNNYNMTDT